MLTTMVHGEKGDTWLPNAFITHSSTARGKDQHLDVYIEHFCAVVVHTTTGETITQYRNLERDPTTRDVWQKAFGKQFRQTTQGNTEKNTKGKNCIFIMSHNEISKIQDDRVVTYAHVMVGF